MKLSVIFSVFNQQDLAYGTIRTAIQNLSGDIETEIIVLDNGSKEPVGDYGEKGRVVPIIEATKFENFAANLADMPPETKTCFLKAYRKEKNVGVYPTFWWGLEVATGDILAFPHSDLFIWEKGWDKRVVNEFEANKNLGLIGFIGSNEIDGSGGRGMGTTSNFQGMTYFSGVAAENPRTWIGSPAEPHGARNPGLTKAAVVDGCMMIFPRAVLASIAQRENFPPHHFYDRLLSCEVREKGYEMAVLGIGCDHISGQTVNQEPGYDDMAREWCEAHGLAKGEAHNWDTVIYREAERQWLEEYRDQKHLVPIKV